MRALEREYPVLTSALMMCCVNGSAFLAILYVSRKMVNLVFVWLPLGGVLVYIKVINYILLEDTEGRGVKYEI